MLIMNEKKRSRNTIMRNQLITALLDADDDDITIEQINEKYNGDRIFKVSISVQYIKGDVKNGNY